ncbi:MAG: hypothetical protein JSS67_06990 [Bacteroidetes bacterium]|nr:hypothetical protein [Bacteroidota bacterium]
MLQNTTAQNSMLGMMDPKSKVQEDILQTKVNICQTAYDIRKHPNDNSLNERLSCYNQLLGQLQQLKTQMDQIERQYTNPAEALARKSRLMFSIQGCQL